MTSLLPDESYCTSEIGKLLFQPKTELSASATINRVFDETVLGVTFTAYELEIRFTPKAALDSEPRYFHISTRYKEVNRIQAQLSKLHKQLYLRGTFPSFPSPKFFGKADEATILERKTATGQVLNFVLDSEVLRKARVLHEFLQKAEEIVPSGHTANPDSFLYEGLSNIMDAPMSNEPESGGAVLNPTPVDDESESTSGVDTDIHSSESNPEPLISPRSDSPIDFQFPDLSMLNNRMESSHSQAPSAIRRFLNKVPLTSPFGNSGQPSEHVENYLVQAGKLVSSAQKAEQEHAYELAFHCLKAAAQTLIQGVQNENDLALRNAIRRKTAKYLVRAERLYRTHLAYDGTSFNMEALYAATLQDPNIMAFQCSNAQLKNYQIVGISPDLESETRVYVVEENGGQRLAMKLLQKGSNPLGRTFLPTNVPHMVQLHKFFQTEIFIILLLEFVETGRLWSFLVRYFDEAEKRWQKYENADAKVIEEEKGDDDTENTYKGKHIEFSVGIDYERLARIEQQNLDQEDPSTSELCTVGVDAAADVTASFQLGDSEIVVPGPSMEEELQIRVDEEAPAPLRLKRSQFSQDSGDDNTNVSNLTALPSCLKECALRLNSPRRRAWPSTKIVPESLIVHWSAQIVSMLYILHSNGEFIGDLMPDNLLIGRDGNLMVTYFALWNETGEERKRFEQGYAAPECFMFPVDLSSACDIWSLGAILFELLTGRPLRQAAPHGIGRYGELPIPDCANVSFAARDILQRMLCEEPTERATLDEVRIHSFYGSINWTLYDNPHSSIPLAAAQAVSDIPKSLAPVLSPEQLIPNLTAPPTLE